MDTELMHHLYTVSLFTPKFELVLVSPTLTK